MFFVRLVTAALLLAGFISAALLLGRPQFAVLVALIVALAAYEWARLCRFGARGAALYAAGVVAAFAALTAALLAPAVSDGVQVAVFGIALVFWCVAVPVWLHRGMRASDARLLPLAGIVVLAPAAAAMVALPPPQMLLVLALVWIADTAAYLTGRALGKHKLAPSISPGKTWEGVYGAFIASLAYAAACVSLVPVLERSVHGAVWVSYLLGAALLCGLSVIGDLFESAVKRQASVKDSGRLLPGHGGVLDRIDSATAALPAAALILRGLN